MRIVILSDTHGRQAELPALAGDVLVHCGDLCGDDEGSDLEAVDEWFGAQPFAHRLAIAGNHDFLIERYEQLGKRALANAELIHDREVVIDGIKFYGAPWLPLLEGWPYYLDDEARAEKWQLIPDDTDVLLTHTPPAGVLDRGGDPPQPMGCASLFKRVREVAPSIHCFGHVHASYGDTTIEATRFINAAQVRGGELVNQPVVVELSL